MTTVYSYKMSKQEKLLHKAKNNPGGLHFCEFITLMKHCGWILDKIGKKVVTRSGFHQKGTVYLFRTRMEPQKNIKWNNFYCN